MDISLAEALVFAVIEEVSADDPGHSGAPLRSAAPGLRIAGGWVDPEVQHE
jgi:hypothetical protein